MTPEQLREVLWVVFEKDGNDLFCSTHSQLVKDRHQQLIEEFPDQGPYEVRKYVPYVTHADALEELARLNAAWKAQQFHLEHEEKESEFQELRAERAESALAEAERKGREAGMREAAALLEARDKLAYQHIRDFATQEGVSLDENDYLLGRGDESHGAYMAILAAIGEGK